MRATDAMLSSETRVLSWRGAAERASRTSLGLSTVIAGLFVVLGTALRLAYYVANPALSSDEAALALNLMHRSYSGLFHELDVHQAAPPGFLVLQKLAIDVLGPSPYVLRLLPLIASIAALALFYPVAKRLVDRSTALLALSLFAILDPLLVYAGTNKPYSIDVLVALALYAVLHAVSDRLDARGALILLVAGAIAVWLSYASVFVLAVVVLLVLVDALRTRGSAGLVTILAPVALLVASFAAAYALTNASVVQLQRSLGENTSLFTKEGQPGLLQTIGGMARFLLGVPALNHTARSAIALLGIALAVVGAAALARTRLRIGVVLVLPGIIALVAGSTSKYALFPRTFLFVIPALALLTARGAVYLMSRSRLAPVLLGGVAFAFVVASASYGTVDRFHSLHHADSVDTLRYLTQHVRRGDAVYLHLSAQLDFRYYLECGCFGSAELVRKARSLWPVEGAISGRPFLKSVPPNLTAGSVTARLPSYYVSELAPFRGRSRVWVFVMDPTARTQRALRQYLLEIGREKDSFPRSDPKTTASVALFDLR